MTPGSEDPGGYVAPERLPRPFELRAPSALPVYVFGLVTSGIVGALLLAASQLAYVMIVYSVLAGLVIGQALALGVRWGGYTFGVRNVSIACTLTTYLALNAGLYLQATWGVEGSHPSFLSFLYFRAANQQLPLAGLAPDPLWTLLAWTCDLGITGYLAWRIASACVDQLRLDSVPSAVTELVLYLLFEGHSTDEVKERLAELGWGDPTDVVRALQAAEATMTLIHSRKATSASAAEATD